MHVVIFAGGSYRPGKALFSVLARADLIIAADSGAATALQYGFTPAFVVGDLDSLDPQLTQQLRQSGSEVLQAPIEKDETDTELAVQLAIEKGATEITLLGALGGQRFDHAIANILLLAGLPTPPTRVTPHPPHPCHRRPNHLLAPTRPRQNRHQRAYWRPALPLPAHRRRQRHLHTRTLLPFTRWNPLLRQTTRHKQCTY